MTVTSEKCQPLLKLGGGLVPLNLKALNICLYKPKGFIQFEIIINVLVSSF